MAELSTAAGLEIEVVGEDKVDQRNNVTLKSITAKYERLEDNFVGYNHQAQKMLQDFTSSFIAIQILFSIYTTYKQQKGCKWIWILLLEVIIYWLFVAVNAWGVWSHLRKLYERCHFLEDKHKLLINNLNNLINPNQKSISTEKANKSKTVLNVEGKIPNMEKKLKILGKDLKYFEKRNNLHLGLSVLFIFVLSVLNLVSAFMCKIEHK